MSRHDSLKTSGLPQYALAEIVVTATRSERPLYHVPYAIDLITQKEIQRAEAGLSLDEALRAIPGVTVSNRFNLSQGDRLSIRGLGSRAPFGVRGIKIVLDGIPLTMADGQSQLNNLDLGSVGVVEILRGPSSTLYGNAGGGLINIRTQNSSQAPFVFQPQLLAGSDELWKWQIKASGSIGRNSYLVNANKLKLTGFREHSSASSLALNAVGRHELSNHVKLTTVFNYFDAPYLLNPSSQTKTEAVTSPASTRFFVKQQAAGKDTRQGQAGVTLKYHDDADRQFEATIYGLSRSLLNPIPGRIIELDRVAGGLRTVFGRRFQLGNMFLRGTMGADYEMQNDDRMEFENRGIPAAQVDAIAASEIFDSLQYGPRLLDQQEEVLGLGPFAEFEFQPQPTWAFTLGGRYDRYRFKVKDRFTQNDPGDSGSKKMDQFSPMLGLTYRPQKFITLYGNYATAFQTPTTTELSNQPTGEGGFNLDLQPETIRSFELGLKGTWSYGRVSFDLAFYRFTIRDMLIPYQIPNSASEDFFFRNAGEAKNEGAEVKMEWSPIAGLRAALVYTLMNFVFEDFQVETSAGDFVQLAGNEVPGVPSHQLFTGLTYEHASGVYAEVNLRWVAEYFGNDFNGPLPGQNKPVDDFINEAYAVADLRAGFQRQFGNLGIEIFLGINNLFDERYNGSIVPNAAADRFFEPAVGRSWYAGINMPFSQKR